MTGLYEGVCVAMSAVALVAAARGTVDLWRTRTGAAFWPLARAAQVVVLLAAVLGAALLLGAGERGRDLQYAYGLIAAAVSFAAEQLRVASAETVLEARGYARAAEVGDEPEAVQRDVVLAIARRELGVMAAAMGVVVVLGLRGAGVL